jgi:hypothetical protein
MDGWMDIEVTEKKRALGLMSPSDARLCVCVRLEHFSVLSIQYA